MVRYKKLGNAGYFSRCKRCGVWIPKGEMRKHWKTDCDGEKGKREREEISKEIIGITNKIMGVE